MSAAIPPKEINQIIYMYALEGLTQRQISEKTGVSTNTIAKYVKHYKRKREPLKLNQSDLWSMEEIEYLIEWYPYDTRQDLAYALDKTFNQVRAKVQYLMREGLLERKTKKR